MTEKPEAASCEASDKPLLFGRLLRVLAGVAALAALVAYRPASLLLLGLVLFIAVSLVVGGLLAHPGCEILALPSLLARKQLQCF